MISRGLFLELASAAAASLSGAPVPGTELTGRVVRPSDVDYSTARANHNHRLDFRPAAIVFAANANDVSNAVLYANAHHLPLSVRGGVGHDYEGFSLNDGGIVVDLRAMQGVTFDAVTARATVGPGTDLGTVYESLGAHGHTLPGGTCRSVGIAGITTGGGFGILSRTHGMLCDRLERVVLIDARGRVRDSATDPFGADLLWASRGGGGGNYGIVTSLEFAAVPAPDRMVTTTYSWEWTFANVREVTRRWLAWAPNAPRAIFSTLALTAASSGFFNAIGISLGPRDDLEAEMSAAFDGSGVFDKQTGVASYLDTMRLFGDSGSSATSFKAKSSFGREPLPARALDALASSLADGPGPNDAVIFDSFGGAIGDLAPDATAFVHRDARYIMQYMTFWDEDAQGAAKVAWLRALYAAVDPSTAGSSYRNYCDLDLVDWPTRYYGTNYARLQRIKRRFDPAERFRYPQSIVPA
jgi:FAD/FMN-containing dehydrogenase